MKDGYVFFLSFLDYGGALLFYVYSVFGVGDIKWLHSLSYLHFLFYKGWAITLSFVIYR